MRKMAMHAPDTRWATVTFVSRIANSTADYAN
jgi:hypothetical protein